MATVPAIGRAGPAEPLRLVPDPASATKELYERYGAQIYRFCLRELGSREEAEDAAQTTFLNAFRGLDRGVAPEFESAWLHTIAHRVCMSLRRSSFRRGRIESNRDLDVIQELVPAQQPEADELLGLKDALEALPEQQRRALLLREWRGLSCKEIAGELGLSSSAVEMLLFRARRGVVEELTADTPPRRRGLRGRLRASGDMGSVIAAVKTLFFTGGTKIVATLVAASSVVAATPATRHAIADFVTQPAHHAGARPKAPHVKRPVRVSTRSTSVPPATETVVPAQAETDAKATTTAKANSKALRLRRGLRTHSAPASTSGRRVAATRTTPQPSTPAASAVLSPAQPSVAPTVTGAVPPPADGADTASAATPADTAPVPAPAQAPTPAPVPDPTPAPADQPEAAQRAGRLGSTDQKRRVVTPPPASEAAPVPAPAMAAFAPAAGTAGTTVRITGSHLTGATAVAFNGVSASFRVDNDSQLRATVPDGATSGAISVSTPAGTASGTAVFTVATPPPATPPVAAPTISISGFSPSSGAVGTAVTISGVQFTGARSVMFNGTSASFTVTSDSEISALLPAGATTGLVTVTTKKAVATSAGDFTVAVRAPAIASLSPMGEAVGAWVTISGSGFSGASAVSFNGAPATFTVNSDSQIRARVPVGATPGPVSVTSAGGTATSSDTLAVAVAAPSVASLSPSSTVAGARVRVAGSHLSGATAGTASSTFTVAAVPPAPDALPRAAGSARPSRSAARTSPERRP
jgi:RNA polymerase sigma factor (sigma-70 family)